MLILQDGDQLSRLAPSHTDMCLFRLLNLEISRLYVEISLSVVINLNIIQTGYDIETLKKVEALIQADFKNGLPPHLQPNARSMTYVPESDQSRIFVTSHTEFSGLHARDIQKILRERLILVHGNPSDYRYGWDLESFGRLHDVDKKITVHGEFCITLGIIFA
jgi:hypothetical protein